MCILWIVYIEGTFKRVKEGSDLVEETDKEFREVAASVGKAGEVVGQSPLHLRNRLAPLVLINGFIEFRLRFRVETIPHFFSLFRRRSNTSSPGTVSTSPLSI